MVSDAFPPALWNGVADVETMAIAEALLENTGRGNPSVPRKGNDSNLLIVFMFR
jgi:hypothetical protein